VLVDLRRAANFRFLPVKYLDDRQITTISLFSAVFGRVIKEATSGLEAKIAAVHTSANAIVKFATGTDVLDQLGEDAAANVETRKVPNVQRTERCKAQPDTPAHCSVNVFGTGDSTLHKIDDFPHRRTRLRCWVWRVGGRTDSGRLRSQRCFRGNPMPRRVSTSGVPSVAVGVGRRRQSSVEVRLYRTVDGL